MNKGDWYNYMYTKYKGRGYGNTAQVEELK